MRRAPRPARGCPMRRRPTASTFPRSVSAFILLYAPRNLKAPPRWRFSALKKTCAPACSSNCRERSTGVRWATPFRRAPAFSMSSQLSMGLRRHGRLGLDLRLPRGHRRQRPVDHLLSPDLLVAHGRVRAVLDQPEGHVHRLELLLRRTLRAVARERPDGGRIRNWYGFAALADLREGQAHGQARGRALDVALDAGDLAGEEHAVVAFGCGASGSRCAGPLMNVLRCIEPKRTNAAFSRPGIIWKTRFCSGHFHLGLEARRG